MAASKDADIKSRPEGPLDVLLKRPPDNACSRYQYYQRRYYPQPRAKRSEREAAR